MNTNRLLSMAAALAVFLLAAGLVYQQQHDGATSQPPDTVKPDESGATDRQAVAVGDHRVTDTGATQAEPGKAGRDTTGAGCIDPETVDRYEEKMRRLRSEIATLSDELQQQRVLNAQLMSRANSGVDAEGAQNDGNPGDDRSEDQQPDIRVSALKAQVADLKAQKKEFFEDIGTEGMTHEELRVHGSVLDTLGAIDDLEAMIAEEADAQYRMRLFGELREHQYALTSLMAKERRVALRQLARSLGYDESEIDAFGDYVEYIVDMTDSRRSSARVRSRLAK